MHPIASRRAGNQRNHAAREVSIWLVFWLLVSPAVGQTLGTITWPPGWTPVSVLRNRQLRDPDPGITLSAGDRINLLAPSPPQPGEPPAASTKTGTDTA